MEPCLVALDILGADELTPLTASTDMEETVGVVPEPVGLDLGRQLLGSRPHAVEGGGLQQTRHQRLVELDVECSGQPAELAVQVVDQVAVVKQQDIRLVPRVPERRQMPEGALERRRPGATRLVVLDPPPEA